MNLNEQLKNSVGANPYSAEEIDKEATRTGFGEGLVRAGEKFENVVGLCADLTESTKMHLFRNKFPERFIEIGVAEQNLATVASGMAASGKIPFIASYAMFSPGRNWEQIRTTICYNDVPVKIVGAHAGISVGPDGGTHQAIEDIAITRVIPRMEVVVPVDAIEAKKATFEMARSEKPGYIRLAREKSAIVTTEITPFKIGKAYLLHESEKPQAAIVGCGPLLYTAIKAVEELKKEGIDILILNNHTVKPIDEEALVDMAVRCGAIVTLEEHQVAGGMGSAVAEVLARRQPVPMEFLGVQDQFGQSGAPAELVEHYSMGVKDIIKSVKEVIKRK